MTNKKDAGSGSPPAPHGPGYFGPLEISFNQGCQIDIPLRLAIDLIKVPAIAEWALNQVHSDAPAIIQATVKNVIDLAEALLAEGTTRGYIKELPSDDGISRPARMHLRRQIRAQAYQQTSAQAIMKEEQGPNFELAHQLPRV